MSKMQLSDGIYWVGAIDWNVRDLHGYTTRLGTTYNAYLIIDDKITLIDTVKAPFVEEMLSRIREIVDPKEISYIISNHAEMDHSGSLPRIMQEATHAKLITSEKYGEAALARTFHTKWPQLSVKEGDSLEIGQHRLSFHPTPMLHWPDSMMTCVEKDNVLFTMDIFGQHIATSGHFDSDVNIEQVMSEATTYYANIMWPFPTQTLKAVDKIKSLNPAILAPSHGIIWKDYKDKIIDSWGRWGHGETKPLALVIFDTMWGSTEIMAHAITEAIASEGVEVKQLCLSKTHRSDIIGQALEARALAIGSPTLNNGLLPTVADFLTYLKGLKPRGRLGIAFGSYGWGGGATKAINEEMRQAGMEMPETSLDVKYVPDADDLNKCRQLGHEIARKVREWHGKPAEQAG